MFEHRVRYLALGGSLYIVLLVARLFWMQVVEADHWRIEAGKLGQRGIRLASHRGRILDVKGRLLAGDRLEYDLKLRLDRLDDLPWRCDRCARHVHLSEGVAPRRCRECGFTRFSPGIPVDRGPMLTLLGLPPGSFERLTAEATAVYTAAVEEEMRRRERQSGVARRSDVENVLRVRNWPFFSSAPAQAVREVSLHPDRNWGVVVEPVWRRARYGGEAIERLVGTLRPVQREEVDEFKEKGYGWAEILRTRIGKNGMERGFDDRLLNRDGLKIVERDRAGRVVKVLSETAPRDGEDVRLSLDLEMQQRMTDVLERACRKQGATAGAFVAMDPHSGEVLAMVSYRKDPDDPSHPFDPTITNVVPGSVAKLVTAIGALDLETLEAGSIFECRGSWNKINCSHDHGEIDVVEGISGSCNKFFAWAAGKMGIGLFEHWARRLGFGDFTGIEMPNEGDGLVPNPSWKRMQYERNPEFWGQAGWVPGDTWQVGFGRGALLVTPVQVARFMSIIANGGRFVRPSLAVGGGALGDRVISPGTLRVVREGMEAVVTRGTARPGKTELAAYRAAGKTGTAELLPERDLHMSWFAGYAPADRPRVAFACVIKRAPDTGAEAAGPVVVEYLKGAEIR